MQPAVERPTSALPMPRVEGVEHRHLDVGGTRFHIAEAGEGPPVVLLHGWPQHWWSWRAVIASLAERYRVICPDFRGLGWSGGADGSMRFDALARDLLTLIDELGHDRVRLVGHDWGLAVGFRACIRWPNRFERFVALAGVHPWQGSELRWVDFRRPWHLWAVSALGASSLNRLNLGERELRAWRYAGAFTEDEVAIYMMTLRRPSSVAASVRYYREVTAYEVAYGIRSHRSWRLRVPTLQLQGEHDPLTPSTPHSYRRFADDMRLEWLPGCGHFIPEEAPQELLERLHAFL